ncbi:MAG TPA: HAMP domain-containing sensor histidine kinase [Actinopolymorphaceae bacterium]
MRAVRSLGLAARRLWSRLGLDRSLFGRLIVAYTALVLVGLVVIGLLLSYLAGAYIRQENERELARVARRVHVAVLQSGGLSVRPGQAELLNLLAGFLGGTLDVNIWLFNREGTVVATSDQDQAVPGLTVPEAILERVQQGQTVTDSLQLADTSVLFTAVPLIEREQVVGGVLVSKPAEELNRAVARIRETILWVALVVLLLALALGSYLSWSIVRPLRRLRQIVAHIGSGRYPEGDAELAATDDEIGELAAAITHLARELAAAERLRREAEQNQRRLLADVSHELRTPLTTIRGFTEALIDEVETDPVHRRRYLGLIHEQTLHLGRLVDDLLELSRLEAGDIRLVRMPVRLDALARQVVERLSRRAGDNGVALSVTCHDAVGCDYTVIGDPDRLEQVITNLVVNAIDVSSGGEVSLHLEQTGEEVRLEVRDTGPGIDPEDLPYIWERFYRGRHGRRPSGDGRSDGPADGRPGHTGLGLAIVRRLVLMHDGRVDVETHPGQGSVFKVCFPRASG